MSRAAATPPGGAPRATALRADGLLLLTAAIWGAAFVAQRVGMQHMGPFLFNGIRFSLGALVLTPFVLRHDSTDSASLARTLAAGAGAGLILFCGASLQQLGLVHTTAGKAGFITGLYVLLVPVLGLALGQRTRRATWVGASMAAAGMYLLSVTGTWQLARGDGLVLASAVCWAVHVLVLGRLSRNHHWATLAGGQFLCCSALSLGVAGAVEGVSMADLPGAAGALLYGGVLSVGVGYTLQVVAQRAAPPSHAAILLSLESVFAVLAGWALLAERLTARQLLGCTLMLSGCLLAQLASGRRRDQAPAAHLDQP